MPEKPPSRTPDFLLRGPGHGRVCGPALPGTTKCLATLLDNINNIVNSKHCDEQRVQAVARGTRSYLKAGKGSHLKVYLNGKQSVLPMHNAELKKGLVEAVKKQLGLKG